MPGGGSRKAANHLYRTARPDGLIIGNLSSAMVSLAVWENRESSTISINSTILVPRTAPIMRFL